MMGLAEIAAVAVIVLCALQSALLMLYIARMKRRQREYLWNSLELAKFAEMVEAKREEAL
jgi:hypothetical protein